MTSQMGCSAFVFFFYLHLIWCCVCVRACVHACMCRAAIFNMATILKLVCVKGLRGYARFAVLFLPLLSLLTFYPLPFFSSDFFSSERLSPLRMSLFCFFLTFFLTFLYLRTSPHRTNLTLSLARFYIPGPSPRGAVCPKLTLPHWGTVTMMTRALSKRQASELAKDSC